MSSVVANGILCGELISFFSDQCCSFDDISHGPSFYEHRSHRRMLLAEWKVVPLMLVAFQLNSVQNGAHLTSVVAWICTQLWPGITLKHWSFVPIMFECVCVWIIETGEQHSWSVFRVGRAHFFSRFFFNFKLWRASVEVIIIESVNLFLFWKIS